MATPMIITTQKSVNLFSEPGQYDNIKRLAQAVVIEAARAAAAGNLEARAWLSDPETADTWLMIADLDENITRRWLQLGCYMPKGLHRDARERKHGYKKSRPAADPDQPRPRG
jgi:hypothetical protein